MAGILFSYMGRQTSPANPRIFNGRHKKPRAQQHTSQIQFRFSKKQRLRRSQADSCRRQTPACFPGTPYLLLFSRHPAAQQEEGQACQPEIPDAGCRNMKVQNVKTFSKRQIGPQAERNQNKKRIPPSETVPAGRKTDNSTAARPETTGGRQRENGSRETALQGPSAKTCFLPLPGTGFPLCTA